MFTSELEMNFPAEVMELIPEEHRPAGDISEKTMRVYSDSRLGLMVEAKLAESKIFNVHCASEHSAIFAVVGGEPMTLTDPEKVSEDASKALAQGIWNSSLADLSRIRDTFNTYISWMEGQDPQSLLDPTPEMPLDVREAHAQIRALASGGAAPDDPMEMLKRMLGY